jgi:hypothetical protein
MSNVKKSSDIGKPWQGVSYDNNRRKQNTKTSKSKRK